MSKAVSFGIEPHPGRGPNHACHAVQDPRDPVPVPIALPCGRTGRTRAGQERQKGRSAAQSHHRPSPGLPRDNLAAMGLSQVSYSNRGDYSLINIFSFLLFFCTTISRCGIVSERFTSSHAHIALYLFFFFSQSFLTASSQLFCPVILMLALGGNRE